MPFALVMIACGIAGAVAGYTVGFDDGKDAQKAEDKRPRPFGRGESFADEAMDAIIDEAGRVAGASQEAIDALKRDVPWRQN